MRCAARLAAVLLVLSVHLCAGIAGAQPVSISTCRSINSSGSYLLTNNIKAAGDCLVVNADFVTIDLNGFTITGNKTGRGVAASNATALRVRGGVIGDFVIGIQSGGIATVVERMSVFGNTAAGINITGIDSVVKDSQVFVNVGGITVGDDARVLGNTLTGNTGSYALNVGAGSVVRGNVLANNPSIPAALNCGRNSNIQGNAVRGSGAIGLEAISGSVLFDNNIRGSKQYGVLLTGPENVVIGNNVNSNLFGIVLPNNPGQANSTVLANNSSSSNQHGGFVVTGALLINNSATANNTAHDRASDGFEAVNGSNLGVFNSLIGNSSFNNSGYGFQLTCPSLVYGNAAQGNGSGNYTEGTGCLNVFNSPP